MKKNVLLFFFAVSVLCSTLQAKSKNSNAENKLSKEDQIVEAITSGEEKKIGKLLFANSSLTKKKYGSEKDSLLQIALKSNSELSTIRLLLKAGTDPEARNAAGENAVLSACKNNASPAITQEIIKSGTTFPFQRSSRILKKSKDGKTAFDYARDNENLYDVLLKYAKDPSPVYEEAPEEPVELVDPMTGKVIDGTEEVSETESETSEEPEPVLQEEAEAEPALEPETEAESEPAEEIAAAPIVPEVVENADEEYVYEAYRPVYLFEGLEEDEAPLSQEEKKPLEKISNPDKRDAKGRTNLMKASAKDDLDSIRQLLFSDADADALDKDYWTPLMYAARHSKNPETARLLLDAGADPSLKNKYGFTALEIAAAYNNSPDVIRHLISKSDRKTVQKALVTAITQNRPEEIIKQFTDSGVSVNFIYKGMTPLMYAAKTNVETGILRVLLENGASKTVVTSGGKDAFSFAEENFNLPHDSIYWSLNQKENN